MEPGQDGRFDDEADVVVVGLGCAGVCAAIEAADRGARVVVVDRFAGGGSTAQSGGVVYLGGGTRSQREAGVEDSTEDLFAYLEHETRGVVAESTLRQFCEQSAATQDWLEERGVRFGSEVCPHKTSYPTAKYHLYYSGNEPFTDVARPAPRGHRPLGSGMPGRVLYEALCRTAIARGVTVVRRARARELLTEDGAVVGVSCTRLSPGSPAGLAHALLDRLAIHGRYVLISLYGLARPFRRAFDRLEGRGRPLRIRARGGVILSAGGFVQDRQRVERLAPSYLPGTPLGCLGDDGSGIDLGTAVGGATALMERVSAWRFINPPASWVRGVLVGPDGRRFVNEELYGAAIGERMVEAHDGRAWLVLGREQWARARRDLLPDRARWFQTVPAVIAMALGTRRGRTVEALASRCGIHAETLGQTVAEYGRLARSGDPDPLGKSVEALEPLEPPFHAVDCSLGSRVFNCATLTLGGLVVDESTGGVRRADGTVVDGLYAAGRTAVGVTSGGYMSGLSLADAVFSGRRAAGHAAGRALAEH